MRHTYHRITKSHYYILYIAYLLLLISLAAVSIAFPTSALSYQDDYNINFTFNPTISIDITGGDLVIPNLAPGNYSDSNEITISANSNSMGGYTLYATVGSDDDTSTNLTNATSKSNVLNSISQNKPSLSSFDDDKSTWGYSYSTDSGSTWVNGDCDGAANVGYGGLPLYTNIGVKLVDTVNQVGTSTIKFKIGARSVNAQAAGDYSNIINFTAVPKVATITDYAIAYIDSSTEAINVPIPQTGVIASSADSAAVGLSPIVPTRANYAFRGWCTMVAVGNSCHGVIYQPDDVVVVVNDGAAYTMSLYAIWEPECSTHAISGYMQDAQISDCYEDGDSNIMTDRRDSNTYLVKKINGQLWMVQNLRITGILSASDSNFTGADFNVSQYDLANRANCDYNNYINVCSRDSGNSSQGVWYNFAAASAGTIVGEDDSVLAVSDICPSGWRLPTAPAADTDTDFHKLIGVANFSGWQDPTAGLMAFNAVTSGYYNGGYYEGVSYGYWWGNDAYSPTNRIVLMYDSANGKFRADSNNKRTMGYPIRCVRSS